MINRLHLGRLAYFTAVAEELHFTRAAERLHIAQPALSQQIRRLERELEVRLFDRTRRSVRLTDAGRVLLAHSRTLLDASTIARRDVERAARGEFGRIGIGFVPTIGGTALPEAYRAFRVRFPDVEVELREMTDTALQLDLILSDQIQIGLSQFASADNASLRSVHIRTERFTLVALPAAHPLAARRSIHLSQLWAERIITPAAGNPYISQLTESAHRAGASPQLMPITDPVTRLVLVAAGVGVTLLLSSVPRIEHPDIVYRRLTRAGIEIDLHATLRADQQSTHVLAFVDALRSAARRGPSARPAARSSVSLRR